MGNKYKRTDKARYKNLLGKNDSPEKSSLKKQGFYQSQAWRRCRLLVLQRDHYICQLGISKKCTKIATEVHHIAPLEDCPERALDMSNLVSCCWYCHEETKHSKPERRYPVRVIKA